MEQVKMNCIKVEYAACPACGSTTLVGIGKESCHCGQCGTQIQLEIVNKVMDNETEKEEFSQMSLF